jgi:hypothetical protein
MLKPLNIAHVARRQRRSGLFLFLCNFFTLGLHWVVQDCLVLVGGSIQPDPTALSASFCPCGRTTLYNKKRKQADTHLLTCARMLHGEHDDRGFFLRNCYNMRSTPARACRTEATTTGAFSSSQIFHMGSPLGGTRFSCRRFNSARPRRVVFGL